MTAKSNGWGELFDGENGPRVAVLVGGVGLHAVNVFIGGSLMPSVVKDIGGLDLFAWNTTLFIVASIVASIFAAVRPFSIGPRGNYMIAAAAFALGSLICGLAPNMWLMLAGRSVQGFGAGLLVAMTYAMIRIVFPPHLWTRALGLNSGVWGVATLVGPAIGGVFAEFDAWRWAFFILIPFAAGIGLLALRVIPRSSGELGLARVPLRQIGLLIGAMLAISLASVVTADLPLSAALLAAAIIALILLVWLERNAANRLLPTGTFSPRSALAPLFAIMVLLQLAITSDVFVPYFLQVLHGQSPLIAGYIVALMAVGWSSSSVLTSGWTGARARLLVVLGPILVFAGAAGLALFISRLNLEGNLLTVLPVALALIVIGLGMGVLWPHLMGRLLDAAPAGEKDLTTAAMSMAQLFASGLGASLAGMIVNFAGLATATRPAHALLPAAWLYALFAAIPIVAIPIALRLTRGEANLAAAE